jgi:hypothetical protein
LPAEAKKKARKPYDYRPSLQVNKYLSHAWYRAGIPVQIHEDSLINDTLMGSTPGEIALHWGLTSKTVSNEKTRVIQKLRESLLAGEAD